jgi:hypothetical protein
MKQYLLVLQILILCFEYLWTNFEEDGMIMNMKQIKYDEEKEKYGKYGHDEQYDMNKMMMMKGEIY